MGEIMNFSLKAFLDQLDVFPEHKIMSVIMEQYELPGGLLFNNKFIPETEMLMLGYDGFKTLLYSILDTDPDFLETALNELRALTLTLKGDSSNG